MGAAVLGVCLALAASLPPGAEFADPPASAGTVTVRFVPQARFTLAWTHSIEKTRWEEDYRVRRGSDGAPRLELTVARIRGSGAGMEPPPGSVLRGGWYSYAPAQQPSGPLRLTRSPHTADYDWCAQGRCQPLSDLLGSDGGVTLLWPCVGARPGQ